MRVLVAVKQVASLDEEFELDDAGHAVDADFLEHDLNEWDAFALEEAVRLRESGGAEEVVVVTAGPESADETLRTCLAKGADRALRVDTGAGEEHDVLTIARLLAAAVERLQPDVVLCGAQSSDAVAGATGIATAGFAGLAHVAVVRAIEWERAAAVVDRELEGGVSERLRVRMPMLLTVQTGINEPRYANLRAIKLARDKPLDVFTPAELGVGDVVAGSRIVALERPQHRGGAQMLDGDADAVAARIAQIIKDAGVAA